MTRVMASQMGFGSDGDIVENGARMTKCLPRLIRNGGEGTGRHGGGEGEGAQSEPTRF